MGSRGRYKGLAARTQVEYRVKQKAIFNSGNLLLQSVWHCDDPYNNGEYENGYRPLVSAATASSVTVGLMRTISTIHAGPLVSESRNWSVQTGDTIVTRVRIDGLVVSCWIWNETNESEPSTPLFTFTDDTQRPAGFLYIHYNNGNGAVATGFDDTTISDLAPAGDPPQGTVTISNVTPGETSAVVTYSYNDTDQTGFQYRLNGGTPASLGASPATITGLTAETEYDLEARAINAFGNGAWSSVSTFTTGAVVLPTVSVSDPLKNNTGTVLANETGVKCAVLSAANLSVVYTTSSATTNASGILSPLADAGITTGQSYHVAIKTADGGVGITGAITAS